MSKRVAKLVISLLMLAPVCMHSASCQTGAKKSAAVVLHFPAVCVGRLWITDRPPEPYSYKQGGDARGDVEIPSGSTVGLKLSYAGCQNLGFLRRMDTSLITRFSASKMDFDDQSAANLQYLKALQILDLNNTEIDDGAIKYLANLKELRWLDVDQTNITGKALLSLSGLTHLKDLSAMYCNLSDSDLAPLAGLPLTHLRLNGTDIGDNAMEAVGKMKLLKSLRLSRNKRITDKGMVHLTELNKLRDIDISETAVTPAGAKYLKKLTNLKTLCISYHSFTPAQIKAFETAVPGVKVVDRFAITPETEELFAPLHSPIAPQGRGIH